MSETQPAPEAPQEQQWGEPAAKSDVNLPASPSLGGADPADQPAAEAESPKEVAEKPEEAKPEPKREDWRETRLRQQSARIAAEAKRADAAERKLADLQAAAAKPADGQPATPREPPQSPEAFERAVTERAAAMAEQAAFDADCGKIATSGAAEYPDFVETLKTLWEATDGVQNGRWTRSAQALIEASLETDKPHAVLYHLGQNPNEAIRIAGLKSDAKRGAAIAKLAAGLATAAAAPKPVSKAPAPLEPVSGAAKAEVGAAGPKETGAWIKWREEQIKAKRAS